jgi:DNA-binding CsgD family transcriptional regulator
MLAMSMVGRVRERAELLTAWERAASGRGPVTAVITGDPGLGKSLLITTAVAAFNPRPRAVLSGTARVHAPAPYDWLAAVLTGVELESLPVPAGALAWLGQNPAVRGERFAPAALLRMAVRTVRTLVGGGPAVLVVEDLHALDPASLNLVGELAATPDLPVLLLVTSQLPDAAISPRLAARTLARLSGSVGAVRQHLSPLARPDIAALLAQVYPGPVADDVVDAVWKHTGGNPYCLRELLVTAGGDGPEALAVGPLPAHVRGLRKQRRRRSATRADAPARRPAADPDLTAREREVLACLAAGMSDKQVARSLGISIRTVNAHVSNLLRKTRLTSRTEAALWAVRHPALGSPAAS